MLLLQIYRFTGSGSSSSPTAFGLTVPSMMKLQLQPLSQNFGG